jgi:hypothetical protein
MTDEHAVVVLLCSTAYRIVAILVGFGFGGLGYLLFVKGYSALERRRRTDEGAPGGHAHIKMPFVTFLVGDLAPGTYFALFGMAIVVVTVARGYSFAYQPITGGANVATPSHVGSTESQLDSESID